MWKRFHSSAVVPTVTGTPAALPASTASSGGHAVGDPLGDLERLHVRRRAALGDGPVEQPGRLGDAEQRADTHGARRLAEDRDIAGVAAEAGDVVAHPPQGGDLVADAVGAGAGEGRVDMAEVEEPER